MRNKTYPYIFLGAAVSLAACNQQQVAENMATSAETIDWNYMDTNTDPKVDFYQFSNGNWLKDNPVPETEGRWGSFNEVMKRNNKKIKAILKECSTGTFDKGSSEQLIGDYYSAIMDSNSRNEAGLAPIKADMEMISKIASHQDVLMQAAYNQQYGMNGLFGFYIGQDAKDVETNIIHLGQGGIGLPDRDYYFRPDSAADATRSLYKEHIADMLTRVGYEKSKAKKAAQNIFKLEEQLAENCMTMVERRNPKNTYNKTTLDEFVKEHKGLDWGAYFNKMLGDKTGALNVGQPKFFAGLNNIIVKTPVSTWKDYYNWNLINGASGTLTDELEAADWNFYNHTLQGVKVMKPRWKRAIQAMNWSLGEPMGKVYVSRHFPEESKQKVNAMVDDIEAIFGERIKNLEWMTPETKEQALAKLNSFTRKFGYPDKWKDMSSVDITKSSYYQNRKNLSHFGHKDMMDKLGKPVDKTEWGMPAHIVNAYYNPTMNEIVFPAGILQPPFFNPEAEDAVNYARMGAVIGHELTHGFDDSGRRFDAKGLLKDWWSPSDNSQFTERAELMAAQYGEYEPLDGVKVNGKLTLGENIADFGGLTIAYYAYLRSLEGKEKKEINGYTPEQRFFIAFGQIWKTNYKNERLRHQIQTDPHSPAQYRVIGPLSNMPEFFEAFNVQEGDPMRRPADKLVKIW